MIVPGLTLLAIAVNVDYYSTAVQSLPVPRPGPIRWRLGSSAVVVAGIPLLPASKVVVCPRPTQGHREPVPHRARPRSCRRRSGGHPAGAQVRFPPVGSPHYLDKPTPGGVRGGGPIHRLRWRPCVAL